MTAEIVVPTTGARGSHRRPQGGNAGGWSLYAKGGKLKYCYNFFGIHYFYAESSDALSPGEHQLRIELAYAAVVDCGKGGTATLYVDGKKSGRAGKVGATEPMLFSADDGCDVGVDTGAPVAHRTMGLAGMSFQVASRASSSPLPRTLRASITSSRRRAHAHRHGTAVNGSNCRLTISRRGEVDSTPKSCAGTFGELVSRAAPSKVSLRFRHCVVEAET